MKRSLLLFMALATMVLFGCKERAYIDAPGDNSHNTDSVTVVTPDPDPEGVTLPEGTISTNEAVDIARKLKTDEITDESYCIKGWVVGFEDKNNQRNDADFQKYGSEYFYISSYKSGSGQRNFYCYRAKGKGNQALPDRECVQYGDFVVIQCRIQNYKGNTPENSGSCPVIYSTNPHFNEVFSE